ncbi:WXG100 family type VII secretion target [Nocardioides renjunii]|uniref:WXG100 family type VII secretion target n=1 Tax=Nocardioides renjunii TaxID=3095075 RepID=UPI002B001503|nr:WXG100 family type VII secretion target [Nocardioides sp. S-34]WQQ21636.1 WXG100 family type VII secretion target [Nocardioides sp. S-34]
MTAFDVDLDELRRAVSELASCHRGLLALAYDVDQAHDQLQAGWSGQASAAEEASYDAWRSRRADMVAALAALTAIATAADEHYSRAVDANLARWAQVTA